MPFAIFDSPETVKNRKAVKKRTISQCQFHCPSLRFLHLCHFLLECHCHFVVHPFVKVPIDFWSKVRQNRNIDTSIPLNRGHEVSWVSFRRAHYSPMFAVVHIHSHVCIFQCILNFMNFIKENKNIILNLTKNIINLQKKTLSKANPRTFYYGQVLYYLKK
jgi:hypothetical protein